MSEAAMMHVEIDCDERGCRVVGVLRNHSRVPLSDRMRSRGHARAVALRQAEFYRCQIRARDRAAPGPLPSRIRTQRWGG